MAEAWRVKSLREVPGTGIARTKVLREGEQRVGGRAKETTHTSGAGNFF